MLKPTQTRKIKPTRRSVSGVYAFKGISPIPFESTLERDFLIRTEFFSNVLDVIPQPVQVPFTGKNGQKYIYTPDFLVYRKLGFRTPNNYPKPQLIEVKPTNEWRKNWREWLPKWKAAYRFAKNEGWEFRIMDESRIRDQVLKNIRFLDPYKRMNFSNEESAWILKNLQEMGSTTFDYLLSRHFMGMYRSQGIAHIWHLLATHQLECNILFPFNDLTELWIPNNE